MSHRHLDGILRVVRLLATLLLLLDLSVVGERHPLLVLFDLLLVQFAHRIQERAQRRRFQADLPPHRRRLFLVLERKVLLGWDAPLNRHVKAVIPHWCFLLHFRALFLHCHLWPFNDLDRDPIIQFDVS